MKKILFVSRCAWTLYNFRKDIMLFFKNKGFKVYALGGKEGNYEDKLKKIGIDYIKIPTSQKSINFISDIKLFISLIILYKRLKPDIIFHYTIKPLIYGNIAAFLVKFKNTYNFITGLGYVFISAKKFLRWTIQTLYKISLFNCEKILFYNEQDLSFFLRNQIGDPTRFSIIPGSGVDMQTFSPGKKNGENGITVGMISRFLAEKGVWEFVENAKSLKEHIKNIRFMMIGGRDPRNPSTVSEEDVKNWKKIGIEVYDRTDNVSEFLKKIDILIHPTYREGFSRILLEAMASEVPIITTNVPGCKDVIDNGYQGFLVPLKHLDMLQKKTKILIFSPKLRKKMGKRGREKVEKRFKNTIIFEKIFRFIS